ncbi:hypothetical protein VT84_23515 [Gemmata sp. SH-PL17]|nr:hypothetical protein [Gemmata sp. SH-PL17]AMV27388.1 hypothetical protein VT84_23515 [Gemmata sp. SH-PL17]
MASLILMAVVAARFRYRSGRSVRRAAPRESRAMRLQDGSGTLTENTNRPPGRRTRAISLKSWSYASLVLSPVIGFRDLA